MKTFFIALFLGIFIGAIVTAYFKTPEEFADILTPERKEKIDDKIDRIGDKFGDYKDKVEDKLEKKSEPEPAPESATSTTPSSTAPPSITETEPTQEAEEEPGIIDRISTTAAGLFDSSADKRIKSNIVSKLKLAEDVDFSSIEVDVKDGDVTLSGKLNDASLAAKVSLLAVETKGVKKVHSDIQIVPAN